MKILGETPDGYIIDVTKHEMARLRGFQSPFANGYRAPNSGMEFDVTDLANKAIYLRETSAKDLVDLESRLSKMLDTVKDARELVQKLNLFEDLKEQ